MGEGMKNAAKQGKNGLAWGYLLGLAAAVCYGTNALFSLPLLHAGIGVDSVLFLRYLSALPLYALIAAGLKRVSLALPREAVLPVAVLSLLFVGSSLALYSSFLTIDGGLACTILFVYPAMVTFLSACFFGEKLTGRLLAALAATSAGVVLLYHGDGETAMDARGVAWALASAAFYALYILGVRHIRPVKALPAETLTFYVMLFGMLVFAAKLAAAGSVQLPAEPLHWGCVLAIALIPTIVALETFTRSLRRIGAVRLAILGSVEPPVAIAFGVCCYGEALTLRILLGVGLILSGILAVIRR